MVLVNGNQMAVVCPQCGSPAAVHSIQELADLARMQLDQMQQGYPGAQPGWPPQPPPRPRSSPMIDPSSDQTSLTDDLAGLALGEAARFIGRAIGRRVQRTYAERVQPTVAAQGEEMLRTQITIAERHPDVCACLNDAVIFLAGGQRVLPMPNLSTLTVEQADALVATLNQAP